MHPDSLRFGSAVQIIASEARRLGLDVPGFRSPPGITGVTRTIRLRPGSKVVAVALRGRPMSDIVADLVEGVVIANHLKGASASRCRRRLTAVLEDEVRGAA